MSEVTNSSEVRQPVVTVVVGRQRVGKTSFLNTTVQFLRAHGGEVVVWNADMLNRTYSLSMFSDGVLEPSGADPGDVKAWLEDRFLHLAEHRYDAVLDIGGGDTPLSKLVEEVPIVSALEQHGIRMLLVHVLGPDMADLDYLERFMAENLLTSEATLIVLNDGLVITGRSANFAFAAVREHPVVLEALEHGAKLVLMPRLSCMAQVTDRQLNFADAMNGVNAPGTASLSFFDQARVAVWWNRDLPKFYSSIPALWLPAMPGFVRTPAAAPGGAAPASSSKKRGAANG